MISQGESNPGRKEHDSFGDIEVPAGALWGAQTERARLNFAGIGGGPLPHEFIAAVASIKAAAARANARLQLLAPEVARFDPVRALDGGVDGLDGYRSVARHASLLAAPHGIVVLELGAGQGAAVSSLMQGAGFAACGLPRPDLAGIPRALTLRRGP